MTWGPDSPHTSEYFERRGVTDPRALTALVDTFGWTTDSCDLAYVMGYLMVLDGDKDGDAFRSMVLAHMGGYIAPGVVSVLVEIYVSQRSAKHVGTASVPTQPSE